MRPIHTNLGLWTMMRVYYWDWMDLLDPSDPESGWWQLGMDDGPWEQILGGKG